MADPKQIADALAQDQLLAQFNRNEAQAQPWYMKPMDMEGRATFLPFKDTLPGSVMNQRELALPGLLAGAVNAFTAPSRVSTQGFDAPEEAQNLAMNVMGGGISTGKMMRNPTGVGGKDVGMSLFNTEGLPNKGADLIQNSAETLAQQLKDKGFEVTLDHSGSKAGPSSYLRIYDPETGRFINNVRMSGHAKGVEGSANVLNIASPEEMQGVMQSALDMRGRGPSEGMLAIQKQDEIRAAKLLSSGIKKPIDYAKALEIEKTRLYHGSYDENLNTVENKGVFGGIFGSPTEQSALSHGNNLYYSDIPQNKILTHYNLNYEIPYEQVSQALIKSYPSLKKDKELYDKVWDIVVADKGQNINHLNEDDLLKIFHTNDFAEAGLEAQKIRGQVSKNLGYSAVELGDEHGTSYLLQPGVKLEKK
jgi:hypothetical protein